MNRIIRKLFPARTGDGIPTCVAEDAHFLLFIGSARTGSTMLGYLLNNHPSCLISNEARVLQKMMPTNWRGQTPSDLRRALQDAICPAAFDLFIEGFEKHQKWGNSLGTYQKQWQSFADSPRQFPKEKIRVFGDKKAGGHSELYAAQPDEFSSLVLALRPVKVVQLIRNPVDTVMSLRRSHKYELDEAISLVLSATRSGISMRKLLPDDSIAIYYEELQKSPQDVLIELSDFLSIPRNQPWIEVAAQLISPPARYDVEQAVVDRVRRGISSHDLDSIFARYFE